MSAPNIARLELISYAIDGLPKSDYPRIRGLLHHAFYYHNQGWLVLPARKLGRLVYTLQYMYAVEAADWEYQLHGCAHYRNS